MMQRHYDDEALIALLESDRAAEDTHIPGCPVCSEKVESFRMIADCLADADVWDTRELPMDAVPSTVATLRAFATRMEDEDARAAAILPQLLSGERETWQGRLGEHPEWRTAGLVRALIARASDAVMQVPLDGLEMTRLATDVAGVLDATDHPQAMAQLRGAAWREHAYALYYCSDYRAAENAIVRADAEFDLCTVDEYERARLGIVKTLVLRAVERFEEAIAFADASARTFGHFDDAQRSASAKLAQVHMLFTRNEYAAAERLLLELNAQLERSGDIDTHARVLGNLGLCERRLKKFDDAIRHQEMSAELHAMNGVVTEVARTRWNVAGTLADAGRFADAERRLREVMVEFDQLSMVNEAAVVALDTAELLLAQDRFDEVDHFCRSAIEMFERAGVPYSARARTAIAFMQEAVSGRTATRHLVRAVREYIHRLPAQPNLLFAPSPGDFERPK